MSPAPKVPNERQRLAALARYGILDTLPEPDFDELVQLAAQICEAPMALVSLVDENRQWFKARVGFELAETPRDISFCGHAISKANLFVVPDTAADRRFAGNPMVTGELGIRFYAGAQLRTPEGHALGTLCVMDRVPRELTPVQKTAMATLARQVMTQLDLRWRLAELQESRVDRANILASALDGIIIIDHEGHILEFNPAAEKMFGYPQGEVLGRTLEETIVPPEFAAAHREGLQRYLRTGEARVLGRHIEISARRADGTVFPVDLSISRNTLADPPQFVGFLRDITEHKRSESRFRRLVESNAQGVIFWDRDGAITEANDAFLKIVGHTREELAAGKVNWMAMTPPEFAEADRRAFVELEATGVCTPFEKEYLRADGSRVPVLAGAATFEDDHSHGVCFVVDLTERKNLERQFLRAQRMESIGTLAGGIAHDLNNALSPILISVELLRMRFPDPESQALISMISTSAQRGADMVRQVLSFARGVEGQRLSVQIKHLIRDMEKIANDTFLKHVEVRTALADHLWTVCGDATQLHQVLLNLCVNARDAMPNGGTLTLSARNAMLDEQYASMNIEAKPGPYVVVEVEDTGTGIAPEVIEKIFDPFFTTKELGKGTGLGLSTSLAIVKSHGGYVRVESKVGRGTSFKVYLPAEAGATPPPVPATSEWVMTRGHGELILFVDDEPSAQHMTRQTLEAFGYRALTAGDGAEALSIYAAHQEEIAAVVTDMNMPIMGGSALIQVLHKMDPDLPVVAASGLASNQPAAQPRNIDVKHFLLKPYTAQALLKILHQVLAERRGERSARS